MRAPLFSFTNLSDRQQEAKISLLVLGMPSKVVIDRAGNVVWWRSGGPIERDVLAGVIEDALAGRRPTAEKKAVYPEAPGA